LQWEVVPGPAAAAAIAAVVAVFEWE